MNFCLLIYILLPYLLLVFNFLIYFGGVSRYIIQVYYLFLSNSYTSCPILLADTSNTTFNSSVDNGLFLHIPDFSRKASSVSLLSCVKEIAIDYYFLIYLIFLPCQEGVLNLLIFFSVSFKMLIKIFSSDQWGKQHLF